MSDSSRKRVLILSCGRSFPPVFPVFFSEMLLGCMSFRHGWKCDALDLG